ncbi:MAG: Asp-tRNA(Asn)/Glu-tRNA(Gln) amidotransferase GatCAB subunit A [Ignavibacteriales bacterium CG18_big_fil_WC_8_21_14_2_50_31_20]|nr:MAG: Asp-tRNA(Asn)/Glu-tRNA(Gln) amidotransferase GatCAB subunit A [Ignavibacteriales bacterium CG18_big_fil_WC_8_21_14_2_50_31_20]
MLQYKNHLEKLAKLKVKEISLIENVQTFLDKIELNKDLNAFNFVFEDALEQAKIVEEKIFNGTYGKLAGMVIAIKDVLAIKDKPLTCSSKILENFNSVYTATAIQKLIDEDAIIIGKTNCDEFAMGSSNENSAFGKVLNPIDKTRVPGGSSGGSAVAVAANLCDVSLGTDTGGSIRQPASFCGIFGLKPTYGRVSRYGLTAFASSFDTIGPFANNVEDIALILSVLSGKDEFDSTSKEIDIPNFLELLNEKNKIKIGIPQEFFGEGLNEEIKNIIQKKIDFLSQNEKIEFVDIHLPHNQYSIATYYILTTAEASANLQRYDGVRYGVRDKNQNELDEMYTQTRSNGFGKEVKRRIMLGTYVLSSGYYDAYYTKAQKVRRLIQEDFQNAFKKVDVILTPTSPFTAFKIGEKLSNPLEMYLSDIYTTSANLAGIPGISIPVGNDSNGLPIGLQLLANQFNEALLLQTAKKLIHKINE